MFWDLVLTEIELTAFSPKLVEQCPVVVKENASYVDIIKEVLDPDNDDLGVEAHCNGCQFQINAPDYLNCALIAEKMAVKFKGFSFGEVAEMLDISKSAMEKLEMRINIKLLRNVIDEPTTSKEIRAYRKYVKKKYGLK